MKHPERVHRRPDGQHFFLFFFFVLLSIFLLLLLTRLLDDDAAGRRELRSVRPEGERGPSFASFRRVTLCREYSSFLQRTHAIEWRFHRDVLRLEQIQTLCIDREIESVRTGDNSTSFLGDVGRRLLLSRRRLAGLAKDVGHHGKL